MSEVNQEDVTLPPAADEAPFDLDNSTLEELKAQLLALKAERDALAAKSKKTKTAAPVVERTPEEQAKWDADKAEAEEVFKVAEEALADAEADFKAAKAALAVFNPKALSNVKRGPSGVGTFIKGLINEGKTNEEIMTAIAEQWPDNFTNTNCINWYRNAIKKWGPEGKAPPKTKVTVTVESSDDEPTDDDMADYPEEDQE